MRLPYRMDRAVAHGRFSDFCRHPVQTARPVLHSGLITLLLFLAYPIYINRSLSGGFFGTAYYTIFTG
ncbi:MAG: hypothetical protein ACLT38_08760 [Akkermansia sp.]